MERQMKRATLIVVVLLATAGCENPWQRHAVGESRLLSRSWVARENPERLEPVYCYRTLAGVECFIEPRANDSRQLIETYRTAAD
jgi:hypothetical protein